MNIQVEMQTKLDAYKAARDMRLEEQRRVDQLQKQERELQGQIIEYLLEHPEINGIMGTTHKALVKDSEVPIITDLEAFQDYIMNTGEWDLAYSLRPSAPAIRERTEAGVDVPGIEFVTDHKLSVTKI